MDESARDAATSNVPRRLGTWLSLLLLVVLVSGAALVAPVAAQSDGATTSSGNTTVSSNLVASSTPDPAQDRLGWENGVWYNATLAIDESDGLNSSELDAVVARTMARVERVRELEFQRTPPVRLISASQQREEAGNRISPNATARLTLNAQYEALFLIPESANAVDSQEALFAGGVSGYYAPGTQRITMVSPTEDPLRIQEGVLSQELFHAQQDQYFTLSSGYETVEGRNARNGVVEGDANYVQYLYEQRCANEWSGSCLIPDTGQRSPGDRPDALNVGMVQLFLQPYNSGLDFVRGIERNRGWDAVDALYEQYPASTEQTIHPSKYPDDRPANLTVPDRSSSEWRPLTSDGEQVTSSVGEAGLFVALWYPAYETRGSAQIIPLRTHIRIDPATGQPRQPVGYNYSHPTTTGWDGDRLVPYVPNNSTATETALDELGYVYKTAWDSEADARGFADAYERLLEYNDGQRVPNRANTLRLPEDSDFADTVWLSVDGNRVTIVNAPSVEALRDIRPAGAPTVEKNQSDEGGVNGTATPTVTPTPTPGDSTANGTVTATPQNGTATPAASGPGFGVLGVVVALIALVTATRWTSAR